MVPSLSFLMGVCVFKRESEATRGFILRLYLKHYFKGDVPSGCLVREALKAVVIADGSSVSYDGIT